MLVSNPLASTLAFSFDGGILAVGETIGALCLYDTLTGREIARFAGHEGAIRAIRFAPDGRSVATCSDDSTALVWAVPNPSPGGTEVTDWDQAFQSLRDNSGPDVTAALRAFTLPGGVAALGRRLETRALSDREIPKLIEDLNAGDFSVREAAFNRLQGRFEALALLRAAVAKQPGLEVRQRLDALIQPLEERRLVEESLRQYRAVEILERSSTAEARELLEAWAGMDNQGFLATEARAALARLKLVSRDR